MASCCSGNLLAVIIGIEEDLTPRQREVLGLIAQGLSNSAIAQQLTLSEKSVENQINLVYQNLGIQRTGSGSNHPRVLAVLRYLHDSRILPYV